MLEVKDISFAYGNHRPLFKDLSFTLNRGEILRITGSNGKGKSTLMKCLLGLLTADKGEVLFDGDLDLYNLRANTEYIAPETNAHFEDLSATENIETWTSLKGLTHSTAHTETQLADWGFRDQYLIKKLPVEKFSTGMKRRLAIVRISLSESPLWFLDEPIYGLDKEGVSKFTNLLQKHVNNGGMALMISHDESIFSLAPKINVQEMELI